MSQTNATESFPYQDKIDEARRFLEQRGIRDVKPLYRAAPASRPATAEQKARTRWFGRAAPAR